MTHYDLPHEHDRNIQRVLENMPASEKFSEASWLFQQLGDSTRLKILWLLCHSKECVSDIAAAVGMSKAAVSHHLQLLKRSGLVTDERVGREIHYTLAENLKASLFHRTIDAMLELTCPVQ